MYICTYLHICDTFVFIHYTYTNICMSPNTMFVCLCVWCVCV